MELLRQNGEYDTYDHRNNMCHGIAYDEKRQEFYVTGKRWNLMFKIRLVKKTDKIELLAEPSEML